MVLTLSGDKMNVNKLYIDLSHAVHSDMKQHTDAVMTFSKESIYDSSIKQKINKRISTESELFGADDILPQLFFRITIL